MNLDPDRYNPDRHNPDRHDIHPDDREREISLGTATIVGIFLALALVCAAFFGFGYSLGRHLASASPVVAASVPETKAESPFTHFKSSASPPAKTSEGNPDTADTQSTDTATIPTSARKPANSQAHPVALPVPAAPAAVATDLSVASTGQFIVQVSAPSRQGDADALIAALTRKGYKAFIHKEPQDNFFHVQVGPYATKTDAQVMVKRLDNDGYKPFVK